MKPWSVKRWQWSRGRIGAGFVWLAALVALAQGCSRGDGTYYVAAEHDLPAHKPADFPEAVARLESLLQHYFDVRVDATPIAEAPPLSVDEVWSSLAELAGWLGELAIDSDLDEANWLIARDRGADIQAWLAAHAADPKPAEAVAQDADQWRDWLGDLKRVAETYRQLHVVMPQEEE